MRLYRVLAVLAVATIPASADAQIFFAENFDTYVAGSTIAGQGGWETWDNLPAANTTVVNTQSFTTPNSLAVSGAADIVHQFVGANAGASATWFARIQTFVPSTASGDLFFILLNQYVPGSIPSDNWSVQVALCRTGCITGIPGTVANLGGSDVLGTATAPLILDQWVELRAEINLTANTYSIFYNQQLLETLPWTQTGTLQIAAVDLYSQSNTVGFMDGFYLDEALPVELTGFQVE
jgi:hypothetical protein